MAQGAASLRLIQRSPYLGIVNKICTCGSWGKVSRGDVLQTLDDGLRNNVLVKYGFRPVDYI